MHRYLHEIFGVSLAEAAALRRRAFASHNQTEAGLRAAGYEVDRDAFWRFVRADERGLLASDAAASGDAARVRRLVESLPQAHKVRARARADAGERAASTMSARFPPPSR